MMSISDVCIRRPVFTWVLAAIPAVLGLVSYCRLGVELFPKVDFPVVSVTASLPGTVAFAIIMSLFVSFTLTPMRCSRFLKLDPSEAGHATSKSGFLYRLVDGFYGSTLGWALRHRFIIVCVCVLVILSTGPIAMHMGVNLVPRDDQSEFQVTFLTPAGYTLERTTQVITELEHRLATLPGVVHRFTTIGDTNGSADRGQGDVTRGSKSLTPSVSSLPLS